MYIPRRENNKANNYFFQNKDESSKWDNVKLITQ